jgi:hypothetical protein
VLRSAFLCAGFMASAPWFRQRQRKSLHSSRLLCFYLRRAAA